MRRFGFARFAVLVVAASLAAASVGYRPFGEVVPVDAISREFSFGAGFGDRGQAISREFSFGGGYGDRGQAISREFSFAAGSDLAFTHAVPSQGLVGEVFEIRWTVRNHGLSTASAPWFDRLEFTLPIELEGAGSAMSLDRERLEDLAPGESYTRTERFVFPAMPTSFSARITVDVSGQVIEATDFNNATEWLPIEVVDLHRPDLTVAITNHPVSTVQAGQFLAVDFRVSNHGNVATPAPLWTDRVYLVAADGGQPPASVSGAIRSWSLASQGLLEPDPGGNGSVPGSSYTQPASGLQVPLSTHGDFYLAVLADATDAQLELDETDNLVFSAPITVLPPDRPDLAVGQVAPLLDGTPLADGTSLPSGSMLEVGWTVHNSGSAPFLGGAVRTEVWISSDSSTSGADALDGATNLLLAQANVVLPALGIGASADVATTVAIPMNVGALPGGAAPQRFKVRIDSNDQVWEEESVGVGPYWNNLALGGTSHPATQLATPDVVAQSIGPVAGQTVRAGFPLSIQWNVGESGGGGWGVPFAWRDEVWLSPCTGTVGDPLTCNLVLGEADDVLLGSFGQSATQDAGGWSVTGYPRTATVHLRDDLSGQYRLVLRTDALDQLFESGSGETNNVDASTVFTVDRIPADLSIAVGARDDALQPPASGAPGDAILLPWTVENSATAGVTNVETWTDHVYLSQSSTSYQGGHLLLSVPSDRALPPGGLYDVAENGFVPPNVAAGAWHLHFVTDVGDAVLDDVQPNDQVSVPFQVTDIVADLVVDQVDAAQVLRSSDPVVVEWTVRNAGSAATGVSSWFDRVWFSDAPDLSQASVLHVVGSRFHDGPLGPGSSYSASGAFAFPYGLTPGPWYVIVECDAGYQVYELDGDNNDASTPAILEIAPPPPAPVEPGEEPAAQWLPLNLVTRNVEATLPTVTAGQTIEVSWEVTNEGAGVGNRSHWAESVHLSLDEVLDESEDIYLGSWSNTSFLGVGETRTRTASFVVPLNATGAWKLIVDADPQGQLDQQGLVADDVAASAALVQVQPQQLTNLRVTDVQLPTGPVLLGEPLPFLWTTENDSGADVPAALEWTDHFWLLPQGEDFPDPGMLFLGGIQSNAGLIAAGGGTHVQDAANAGSPLLVPGVAPGPYHIAVRTDALLQIAELEEGDDNDFRSVGTVSLEAIDLPLGGSAQADLANGAMRWFRLTAAADLTVDLEFEHDDPSARCELFVSAGDVPVLGRYELASEGPGAIDAFRQSVRIPRTTGADYFVLARTDSGAGRSIGATLDAVPRDFQLEEVVPTHVGAGVVTIGLQGPELWRASRVELRDPAASSVVGSTQGPHETALLEDGTLLARFDLTGIPHQIVDIVAIDDATGETRTLHSALAIEPAAPLALRAELALPDNVRRGESSTGEIVLRNLGNVDVPVALVTVGHARPAGSIDDVTRILVSSPALGGEGPATDGERDDWALVVEGIAPGREHRVPLDLVVGDDYPADLATFAVAARPCEAGTFVGGPFAAWSRELRLALLADPDLPGQLSGLVPSAPAWNAAVSAAIGAGWIEPVGGGLHTPGAIVRSGRDVIEEIAAGVATYLSLPTGAEVPEGALDEAAASQACIAFVAIAFDCEQLFPGECGAASALAAATTVAGMQVPVGVACVSTPAPDDPTVKITKRGVPPNATVSAQQPLQYEVHFENRESATAWASLVVMVDELQPGFEAASVRFHELRIGRTVIPFAPNTRSFFGQRELQIDADTTMNVQISAFVDATTRVVTVRMQAIDPETGLPPVSGDRGLLAPSIPGNTRPATGYLVLSVSARATENASFAGVPISRSGSSQTNSAVMLMDTQPPLVTNTVSNALDAVGPTSEISSDSSTVALDGVQELSWSATDVEQIPSGEYPGTGVRSYSLYRAPAADGPWSLVVADTQSRTFSFEATESGEHWFQVEATDGVGNVGERSDPLLLFVPFDCNGNGVPDDEDIAAGTEDDCDESGVPDSCELLEGTLTDVNGNGVPDECECLVSSYCPTVPNSSGAPAELDLSGFPSVGGGMTLRLSGLPANRTGQLFLGAGAQQSRRGDGFQCISNPQIQFSRIVQADAAGTATIEIVFDQPHLDAGGIAPGVTRYFQFWYRDGALPGGTGFNSTNGLQVTFCD